MSELNSFPVPEPPDRRRASLFRRSGSNVQTVQETMKEKQVTHLTHGSVFGKQQLLSHYDTVTEAKSYYYTFKTFKTSKHFSVSF